LRPSPIDEIRRVLKLTGRALSLDFNRPSNAPVRALYLRYLTIVGGVLGWILHGDPDTYQYIPASISQLSRRGWRRATHGAWRFTRVQHSRVLGGLMAIHQGFRDARNCRMQISDCRSLQIYCRLVSISLKFNLKSAIICNLKLSETYNFIA
jgi:hypothetical protein